jgi:hypothetical protein
MLFLDNWQMVCFRWPAAVSVGKVVALCLETKVSRWRLLDQLRFRSRCRCSVCPAILGQERLISSDWPHGSCVMALLLL